MRHKATVRKGKNDSWMLDTMVDGVRHREVIGFGTKKWAQAEGDRILGERINGGIVVPPVATLGTLVDAYRVYGESGQAKNGKLRKRTVDCCISSFLLIAQEGGGLDRDSKLRAFTPGIVRNWHSKKLKERMDGEEDELEEGRVLASLYSQWNQSKSLFGSRALIFYKDRGLVGLKEWADEMREVLLPTGEVPAYQIPPLPLVKRTEAAGNKLLAEKRPELWLIYKLAINCGLRASEIREMKRDWVEPYMDGLVVSVVRRADFKQKGTARRVPIDRELWREILEVMGDRLYVLPGKQTERENLIKRDFSEWMNSLGWKSYRKSAHELRKLYGSRIYTELGAEAAREYLGHASIATTCRYYAALDKPLALVAVR